VEHGDSAVGILMHAHASLDVVGAQRALRQLQPEPAPAHRVGPVDHTLLLDAQDLGQRGGVGDCDEATFRQRRGPREADIVGRQVNLLDPVVGGSDVAQPGLRQLLDQPTERPRASGE
jgi:hypothetical protein